MKNLIRLHKVIANAGVASRREAERLIQEGEVKVNGKPVTDLGVQVDPEDCHIKVRGKLIRPPAAKIYLLLNKPVGYMTTQKDPQGRPTVMDLLHGIRVRVFPAGRLDFNSEGLLLLTNDGELANAVMHPKYHLPKIYQAKIKGQPGRAKLEKVARGIRLTEGATAPAEIRNIRMLRANTTLEIVLQEGKNRQIRRMFEKIGHPVLRLKRIRIGPLKLGGLASGAFRKLEPAEIESLKTRLKRKK